MGDRFFQFDRSVDGGDRPGRDLDAALFFTVGTVDPAELFEGHLAGSFFLDHPAKSLSHLVSRQLNLIVVRHAVALLECLNFRR